MVEENARLRNEVSRIDHMFDKIEQRNKQNKIEKAELKQTEKNLRAQSKKIKTLQEDLDYKRQQIEKEQIKLNKAK